MVNKFYLSSLRQESRRLVRELGLLQLNQHQSGQTPSHWHALIEIAREPAITISALSNLLLLSPSSLSRIVDSLVKRGLVKTAEGGDRREKILELTAEGMVELKQIDVFSNPRIIGALDFLQPRDHQQILESLSKYADALEKSRLVREGIKIHTLPPSRPIRQQVVHMIETIQVDEFSISITPDINACILKAEEDFSFNNRCNFWYATNASGLIIGSVGLKKINKMSGEVKKFFVHKNFRGKGTAHKLMKKMVQAAHKNGFKYLYLGTVSHLKAAQSYYKKVGFEIILKKELPQEFDICHLDSVFFKGEVKKIGSYFEKN